MNEKLKEKLYDLSFLGILSVFLSLIYVYVYYNESGLNILPYINFTEIPKYPFHSLFFLILSVSPLAINIFSLNETTNRFRFRKIKTKAPRIKAAYNKYKNLDFSNFITSMLILFMLLLPLNGEIISTLLYILMGLLIINIGVTLFIIRVEEYALCSRIHCDLKKTSMISLIIFLISSTMFLAKMESHDAKTKLIEFEYRNKVYRTGVELYYLGETENFIFTQELYKSKIHVFERSEVSSLKYIKRHEMIIKSLSSNQKKWKLFFSRKNNLLLNKYK